MDLPWKIALSDLDYGMGEEHAVLEVLRAKWLTMGAKTVEFEQRFGAWCGAEHAIAVSNCTAALHLALLAVGVKPGDEVIVPSLTFVATANAVLYCGAVPVFADVYGATRLHLDPADVEHKITSRTTAIVPMHYGGYPCDMGAFRALTDKHGLKLVEDAAHAPGARWRGSRIGSLGDATCFSFFSNKNLATGEGGMVTTNDAAIASNVRINRSHGMTMVTLDRHKGHAFSYDVVSAGYNYRLTELQAALGLVQLAKVDRNNEIRRSLVAAYRRSLAGCANLIVPFAGMDDESACHIMSVVLPDGVDRHGVQLAMKAAGIQTSIHYPPVHRFSSFAGRFSDHVPQVDAVAPRLLTLPLHPLLQPSDVAYICDRLQESVSAVPTADVAASGAR